MKALRQRLCSSPRSWSHFGFAALATFLVAVSVETQELRTIAAADGTVIVHPFRNGMPLPAEGQWSIAEIVGPAIFPKDDKLVLAWVVKVSPKTTTNPLEDTVRVQVEDATDEEARVLFEAVPVFQDGSLAVRSPEQEFSEEEHPWAFTPDDSVLVFRISLIREGGDPEVLWQPVVFDSHFKSQVQQMVKRNEAGPTGARSDDSDDLEGGAEE